MQRETQEFGEGYKINSGEQKFYLVFSIDQNRRIVQFNKDCEKVTGYNRNDAVNRELFEFLIPDNYLDKWAKMFDSVRQNKLVTNFELPWLNNHSQEVMISWSSFPIENSNGVIDDICLIGKLVTSMNIHNELLTGQIQNKADNKTKVNDKINKINNKNKENTILFQLGNKRIIFRKNKSTRSKSATKNKKTNVSLKKEEKNKPVKTKTKKATKKKKIKEDYEDLLRNYNDIYNTIKKLKIKIEALENENKQLKIDLKGLNFEIGNEKKKDDNVSIDQIPVSISRDDSGFFSKKLNFLFDSFSGASKKEEFEKILQELDTRMSGLDNLERQLVHEKRDLKEKRNEFYEWREKLEVLEEEIEKRREDLVDQEKMLKDQLVSSLDKPIYPTSTVLSSDESSFSELGTETDVHHDILDKISGSAAVVQRGILKQINSSFAELIGYDTEEIVNKSLFDFIAPEGFSEVKQFYLNRLKGGDTSMYATVFSTKNNNRIAVEVFTRPGRYNGEKADIALFNKVEKTNEDAAVASDLEVKEEDSSSIDMVDDSQEDTLASDKEEEIPFDRIEDNQTDTEISEGTDVKEKKGDDITTSETEISKEDNEITEKIEDTDKIEDEQEKPQVSIDEVEEKPAKPTVQGGVPGIITQDQINNMVKKAQDNKKEASSSEEPKSEEKEPSSPDEKIDQAEINEMVKKSKDDKDKSVET